MNIVDELRREDDDWPSQVVTPERSLRMRAANEIVRLQEALQEIAHHGTDPPSAANYPEEEWWRKVAFDCMAIAGRALKPKPAKEPAGE